MVSVLVNLRHFNEAKNALLRYYSTSRSSHGVHLIGFTAALFTLIQTAQHSSEWGLSKIFSLEIPPALESIGEIVRPYLFSGIIWFLLFFTIWTIFRFTLFAHYAETLMTVKPTDISVQKDAIHQAIHLILASKVSTRKCYLVIPSCWFIVSGEYGKHRRGYGFCAVLSLFTTMFLIGLLW
jgi:hypothetical protein